MRGNDRWRGMLTQAPASVRVMLTAFLLVVGAGYLAAVANIRTRHEMADGKAGLTIDDVRAVYSGLTVASTDEMPSRMLTMLRGAMRQYVSSDAEFGVLESWLTRGATKDGLSAGDGKLTPERVLMLNCLRCHAASTGTDISKTAPFGPDEFTVDDAMVSKFATAAKGESSGTTRVAPQYSTPRLILVSHIHMLAIPMFTLVVGLLFAMTRTPRLARTAIVPLPMLATIPDFAGWWLARWGDAGVYLVLLGGAVFGVAFGLQLVVVLIDLWRGGERSGS